MASPNTDRIIVGVDFGTTFSGLAIAYGPNASDPDRIHVVKNWPNCGIGKHVEVKVPTTLLYNGSSTTMGYEIGPMEDPFRCFKLLLDSTKALPTWATRRVEYTKSGKTPGEVTVDYLRRLVVIANEEIEMKFKKSFREATPVHYVVGVPAIWSEAAKQATLSAARSAGMTNVTLVSEPEAAAVETLMAIELEGISVGDIYVVCDAGGGSIDLITYEITCLAPLRIREVVPGQGALAGGVFLDHAFIELIETTLGPVKPSQLKAYYPKAWAFALQWWEEKVKRNFIPSPDASVDNELEQVEIPFVGVPEDEFDAITSNLLTLPMSTIAKVFEPTFQNIFTLIDGQLCAVKHSGKTVTGLILVGGLGSSHYLYTRLRDRYQGESTVSRGNSRLHLQSILQSGNAWSAVERGAVICSINQETHVTSRMTRFHYGVLCQPKFVEGKHSVELKYWCPYEETYFASEQMCWMLDKAQVVEANEPVLMSLYHTSGNRVGLRSCILTLWTCDSNTPPSELNSGSGMSVLVYLAVDLSKVRDRHIVKKNNSSGKTYYRVDFKVGLYMSSGNLCFDMRVGGKIYGSVTARFE